MLFRTMLSFALGRSAKHGAGADRASNVKSERGSKGP